MGCFSHNLPYIATLTKGTLDDLDDPTFGDGKENVELVEAPLMFCYQKIWLRGMLWALENILQKCWFQTYFPMCKPV